MPITPGPTNPPFWDADQNEVVQRNAFYHSLAPRARDMFLAELERAQAEGVSDHEAWQRAVVAAETAYAPDAPIDDRL